ncbi:unnamed protein product [Phytophthora fragariaefolia]|uniref:Unnamed protein product n=1 Tax=Phytophthora fragariaefolia TaxID=1490495 RepID=A0A9W6TKL5_9STRA|nr:unnamed protein product [Phytophthora fragariaefolia]
MAMISSSFAVAKLPHAATATSRATKILKVVVDDYQGPCAVSMVGLESCVGRLSRKMYKLPSLRRFDEL